MISPITRRLNTTTSAQGNICSSPGLTLIPQDASSLAFASTIGHEHSSHDLTSRPSPIFASSAGHLALVSCMWHSNGMTLALPTSTTASLSLIDQPLSHSSHPGFLLLAAPLFEQARLQGIHALIQFDTIFLELWHFFCTTYLGYGAYRFTTSYPTSNANIFWFICTTIGVFYIFLGGI